MANTMAQQHQQFCYIYHAPCAQMWQPQMGQGQGQFVQVMWSSQAQQWQAGQPFQHLMMQQEMPQQQPSSQHQQQQFCNNYGCDGGCGGFTGIQPCGGNNNWSAQQNTTWAGQAGRNQHNSKGQAGNNGGNWPRRGGKGHFNNDNIGNHIGSNWAGQGANQAGSWRATNRGGRIGHDGDGGFDSWLARRNNMQPTKGRATSGKPWCQEAQHQQQQQQEEPRKQGGGVAATMFMPSTREQFGSPSASTSGGSRRSSVSEAPPSRLPLPLALVTPVEAGTYEPCYEPWPWA